MDCKRGEGEVGEAGVAGREARKVGGVLKVFYEAVLVVGVHVGEDAGFCRGVFALLVCHCG